ncbi:MAG: lipid-A-disaccharide synthase [Halieaceae bacterium]|jgi:lipid-A-disaccharide synthase
MGPRGLRIGILAGEASGDILGSRVLSALRRQFPNLEAEGIGGPLMEAQGLKSMYPMERLSVMGFVEPLKRLPELLRIRGALYKHFRDNPPDVFLGIDSPDFNLHLEQKLRGQGIKTAHLVSPTIWAWRAGRIKKIKRAVDLMLCLFPFELPIYRAHQMSAVFVGHPLADELLEPMDSLQARRDLGLSDQGKWVALLPGSRGGEVKMLAPLFLQAARLLLQQNPAVKFVLPAASEARAEQIQGYLSDYSDLPITVVAGQSRTAMLAADAVLLASGTATLEAMLLKRPMVVAYRMGAFSWFLSSRLATTRFVSLPNVLAAECVVPELLQDAATPQAMVDALCPLLTQPQVAAAQVAAFEGFHRDLALGYASLAAAALADLALPHE